jgi:hypothetical protein
LNRRSKPKSAHTSSQTEIHPPLPPPPSPSPLEVGHRAENESNAAQSAGGPTFENISVRANSKSALIGHDCRESTSTVRTVLPDNFRYAFSHKSSLSQLFRRFRILVVGKVRTDC